MSISVQQPSSSSRGADRLASCRDYAAAKAKQQMPRHTLEESMFTALSELITHLNPQVARYFIININHLRLYACIPFFEP
jgi:hypothetical protein